MRLLHVILMVALLGLFLGISCSILTWQIIKARRRRNDLHSILEAQRPTRLLMIQNGKVIPISEAVATASTRDIHSLRNSTVGSIKSWKSRRSQHPSLRSPRNSKARNRRGLPVKAHLANQARRPAAGEPKARTAPSPAPSVKELRNNVVSKGTEAEPRTSVSSRKIAASLKEAYRGLPTLEEGTPELPSIARLESFTPLTMTTRSEAKPQLRSSRPDTSKHTFKPIEAWESQYQDLHATPSLHSPILRELGFPEPAKFAGPVPSELPTTSNQITPLHNPPDHSYLNSSLPKSNHNRPASVLSRPPSAKIPPFSPAPRQDPQEKHKAQSRNTPSSKRPPAVQPSQLYIAKSGLLYPVRSPVIFEPELSRESTMSNSSSTPTFLSSDLSLDWTLENAKLVPLVPQIIRRPATASSLPTLHRPKSKYGHHFRVPGEKALPVPPPRSPMSR